MTAVNPAPPSAPRIVFRLTGAAAAVAAAGRVVTSLPPARLPWSDPGLLPEWLAVTAPVDVAVGVLGAVVGALALYLTAVFLLGAIATTVRARPLLRLADALSGGLIGRLAAGSLTAGLGLGALTAGPAGAAVSPRHATPPPAMVVVEASPTPAPAGAATSSDPPVMVVLGPDAPASTGATVDHGATPAPPPSDAAAPKTWTVQRGEHLWSIAEADLQTRLGRAPADAEVAAHWDALIELNRASLADPDNADLLFAGQLLRLPEPT